MKEWGIDGGTNCKESGVKKKEPDLFIEIGYCHKLHVALEDINKNKDEKEGYLHK